MFGGLGGYNASEYLPKFVRSVSLLAPAGSGGSSGPLLPRRGRWSAMPTAMDPRAMSFPTPGVYRSLGFAATSAPESGNASFEVAIDVPDAAQEYIL